MHVLIVDDDPLVTFAVQEALQSYGYRTSVAESGQRALDIDACCPADILITDLDMRGMDGPDLIRHIRTTRPELPVVVLTGRPQRGGVAAFYGYEAAPTELVRKPATLAELITVLDQVAS